MKAGLWQRRRARAIELLSSAPHADEMLELYVGLVELQEGVAEKVGVSAETLGGSAPGIASGRGTAEESPEGASVREARLRVEDLAADALEPLFRDFLRGVEPIGTEVMAHGARALLDGDAVERVTALRAFWRGGDATDFLPRAFTEAVAWALVGGDQADPVGYQADSLGEQADPVDDRADPAGEQADPVDDRADPAGDQADPGRARAEAAFAPTLRLTCPLCASLPQAGVLRDDPGALGRRLLVCSLCAAEWGFPRLTCAHCGSIDADRLQVHQVESVPHVRIEECGACARYIKAVDFRRLGAAEPIVEDLATPELDLWARDRGLMKIRLNVLGL